MQQLCNDYATMMQQSSKIYVFYFEKKNYQSMGACGFTGLMMYVD